MAYLRNRFVPATLVTAAIWLAPQVADAQSYVAAHHPEYPGTTSYWTPGDAQGNWRASLYPAPVPVPAYVGHVYYTYPPLYPHQYMYSHHKVYWQFPVKKWLGGPCGRWRNWSHVHVSYSH